MHYILFDDSKESYAENWVQKIWRNFVKKHKIGTYEVNKISLSCSDDERFILDDGVHTLDRTISQTIINKKRFSQIRR